MVSGIDELYAFNTKDVMRAKENHKTMWAKAAFYVFVLLVYCQGINLKIFICF